MQNPDIWGFEQSSGGGSSSGTGPNDDFSKPGCELLFFFLFLTNLKGALCRVA